MKIQPFELENWLNPACDSEKNKYYLGMVLCEGRQPSIDALHNLIVNLNELHSQNAVTYIAQMHEQGQQILTQRLLKFL